VRARAGGAALFRLKLGVAFQLGRSLASSIHGEPRAACAGESASRTTSGEQGFALARADASPVTRLLAESTRRWRPVTRG
jgi:hypothetical protein